MIPTDWLCTEIRSALEASTGFQFGDHRAPGDSGSEPPTVFGVVTQVSEDEHGRQPMRPRADAVQVIVQVTSVAANARAVRALGDMVKAWIQNADNALADPAARSRVRDRGLLASGSVVSETADGSGAFNLAHRFYFIITARVPAP